MIIKAFTNFFDHCGFHIYSFNHHIHSVIESGGAGVVRTWSWSNDENNSFFKWSVRCELVSSFLHEHGPWFMEVESPRLST